MIFMCINKWYQSRFKISENLSKSSPHQTLAQETGSRCINSSRGGYRRVRTGHYHGYETTLSRCAERGWKWNRAVQSTTAICRSVTLRASSIEGKRDSIPSGASPPTPPACHSTTRKTPPCLLYFSYSHRLVSRESQSLPSHQIWQVHCSSFSFEYIKKEPANAFFKYKLLNYLNILFLNYYLNIN